MSVVKTVLIITLITLVVIASAGIGGYYLLRSVFPFDLSPREIPAELAEPRVLTGADVVTRSVLYRVERSSLLSSLPIDTSRSEKDRARSSGSSISIGIYNFTDVRMVGEQLVAAGQFGAYFFDLQGSFIRSITFEPSARHTKIGPVNHSDMKTPTDEIKIIDLGAYRVGFFSESSSDGVSVYDENGDIMFSQGRTKSDLGDILKSDSESFKDFSDSKYITSAAVGDIDNDGIAEIVVGYNREGIIAYSLTGQELWSIQYPPNAYSLAIKDIDGDGKNELIDIGKTVTVFGTGGTIARTFDIDLYGCLLIEKNDEGNAMLYALDHGEGRFEIKREDGATTFSAPAPLSEVMAKPWAVLSDERSDPEKLELESIHMPKAVWLKLFKDRPKVLAVVGNFIGMPRTNLYVYEASGKLLYHELLDEDAETIAAMPNSDGTESIIVGGLQTIWKFDAK